MKNYKTAVHAARSKVGLKEVDRAAFNITIGHSFYFYLMNCLDQYENGDMLSNIAKNTIKSHHNNLAQLHDTITQAIQRGEP